MTKLRSVGVDVGTTTTQLIVSELTVENRASAFAVPDMEISQRRLLYESPVHFTPMLDKDHVDADALSRLVAQEYERAGITPQSVDTGAIIITGETARKENARRVLEALERFAGEFVVATAGPDLESVLAAKGAGAVALSEQTGKRVLHMDIGGGTSNLALLEDGRILKTGCLNVGGRLLKLDESGCITYVSPVLKGVFPHGVGERPAAEALQALAKTLAQVLEIAAGLRPPMELLERFVTDESSADGLTGAEIFSFSGGVADCICTEQPTLAFGDIGPLLGRAIAESRLCKGEYRLGEQTIRATVIGAGCHSAQLSGSTVYHRDIAFPVKNLPVLEAEGMQATTLRQAMQTYDTTPVIALEGIPSPSYAQVTALAEQILQAAQGAVYVAVQADMAKALGHALALRTDAPILCMDRLHLENGSYLDVGAPVGAALPVVIKTLILKEKL